MTKFQLYVSQASLNLGATKPFNSTETEVSNWMDNENPPTNDALNAEIDRLEAEYNSKKYQRDRAVAYPSIQDVVVALAEKEEGNDAMWEDITAKRLKVKKDHPKP